MPDVKSHHAVGLIIAFTYLQAIVGSIIAGWLFELWFFVPCVFLMPVANFILYRSLRKWEDDHCSHSLLFTSVYTPLNGDELQDNEKRNGNKNLQFVKSTDMYASGSAHCVASWNGSILTVEKISFGTLGIGYEVSGVSAATIAGKWNGSTLIVAGVTEGSICAGQVLQGKL